MYKQKYLKYKKKYIDLQSKQNGGAEVIIPDAPPLSKCRKDIEMCKNYQFFNINNKKCYKKLEDCNIESKYNNTMSYFDNNTSLFRPKNNSFLIGKMNAEIEKKISRKKEELLSSYKYEFDKLFLYKIQFDEFGGKKFIYIVKNVDGDRTSIITFYNDEYWKIKEESNKLWEELTKSESKLLLLLSIFLYLMDTFPKIKDIDNFIDDILFEKVGDITKVDGKLNPLIKFIREEESYGMLYYRCYDKTKEELDEIIEKDKRISFLFDEEIRYKRHLAEELQKELESIKIYELVEDLENKIKGRDIYEYGQKTALGSRSFYIKKFTDLGNSNWYKAISNFIKVSKFDHPNLVKIYPFLMIKENSVFYVMEKVIGFPLSDILHEITPEEDTKIEDQLKKVSTYLDTQKYIFGDFELNDVFWNGYQIKLIDWTRFNGFDNWFRQPSNSHIHSKYFASKNF